MLNRNDIEFVGERFWGAHVIVNVRMHSELWFEHELNLEQWMTSTASSALGIFPKEKHAGCHEHMDFSWRFIRPRSIDKTKIQASIIRSTEPPLKNENGTSIAFKSISGTIMMGSATKQFPGAKNYLQTATRANVDRWNIVISPHFVHLLYAGILVA